MKDSRKRVLIVVTNLEYGGAQRQIVELVNNLDSSRFLVHIASLSDYVPLGSQVTEGVPIHIVRKRYKFDVTVVKRLLDLVSSHRFMILHSYLFDAEIATRLVGFLSRQPVATVGSERNADYKLKRIQLVAHRLTRRLVDVIIANTNAGARFSSEVLGIPREKYRVVYNGVDTERFRPRDKTGVRNGLGIPVEAKLVGVFASFKVQKNHLLLLEAVRSIYRDMPELRLLLVGDTLHSGKQGTDKYREAVIRKISETELKEVCTVVGNQENIEDLYPACDATVLPSGHEGMPNVILESMACGIPVVATRIGDNDRIVIDGETGLLVEAGEQNSLANALSTLLRDDERRLHMGEKSRARVLEQFSSIKLAENTARVYDELAPV